MVDSGTRTRHLEPVIYKTPALQTWTLRFMGIFRKRKKRLTTELNVFLSKNFFRQKIMTANEFGFFFRHLCTKDVAILFSHSVRRCFHNSATIIKRGWRHNRNSAREDALWLSWIEKLLQILLKHYHLGRWEESPISSNPSWIFQAYHSHFRNFVKTQISGRLLNNSSSIHSGKKRKLKFLFGKFCFWSNSQ